MFFFPYLSLLKRQTLILRWSSFRILLLVRPPFLPRMVLYLSFRLSGSPGSHPTFIIHFLLAFPCYQGSLIG